MSQHKFTSQASSRKPQLQKAFVALRLKPTQERTIWKQIENESLQLASDQNKLFKFGTQTEIKQGLKSEEKSNQILKEVRNINSSIFSFEEVIGQIVNNQNQGKVDHINVRNSEITHRLKEYLQNDSLLAFIVTLNQDEKNYQESLSSLNFSKNAGAIQCLLQQNQKITKKTSKNMDDSKDLIKQLFDQLETKEEIISKLNAEIEQLKKQILGKQKNSGNDEINEQNEDSTKQDLQNIKIQLNQFQDMYKKDQQQINLKLDNQSEDLQTIILKKWEKECKTKSQKSIKKLRDLNNKSMPQIQNDKKQFQFDDPDHYKSLEDLEMKDFANLYQNEFQTCYKNPIVILANIDDYEKAVDFVFSSFAFLITGLAIFQGYSKVFLVIQFHKKQKIERVLFTNTQFILLNLTINQNAIENLSQHLQLKLNLMDLFEIKDKNIELFQKSSIYAQMIEIRFMPVDKDKIKIIKDQIISIRQSKIVDLLVFEGEDQLKVLFHLNSKRSSIMLYYFNRFGEFDTFIFKDTIAYYDILKYYSDKLKGHFYEIQDKKFVSLELKNEKGIKKLKVKDIYEK